MGFVTQRLGWQWVYWIFAIISGIQFTLYFFFSLETQYLGPTLKGLPSFKTQYLSFRQIDLTPFTVAELYRPLLLVKYKTVVIPVISHTMIFCLSAAMLTVEILQLFAVRFGFDSKQIGLQFLGIIVSTFLGELFSSSFLIFLRRRALKKPAGEKLDIEQYLSGSYLGFICMIIGLVVFCI